MGAQAVQVTAIAVVPVFLQAGVCGKTSTRAYIGVRYIGEHTSTPEHPSSFYRPRRNGKVLESGLGL